MRNALLALFLSLAIPATAHAQKSGSQPNLSGILNRMQHGDLHQRETACDDLMTYLSSEEPRSSDPLKDFLVQHPDQADSVKLALIHLLEMEDHLFIEGPPGTCTEDDSDDYAELISIVASLDDDWAIPARVGAMTTGGIAESGLLKYGDKALEPVLAHLENSDPLVRATALDMGIALLEKRSGEKADT